MNDASQPHTPPTSRETLTGDRACTQCMHPLVGRAIEREPSTGLLFVRCGECGAATALMEYPSATPWVHRMKTVVATGIVATMLATFLILAGIAGGFATGATMSAATISADAVYNEFLRDHDDPNNAATAGPWNTADRGWLDSAAGTTAILASRSAPEVLVPFVTILGLGVVASIPFALFLGIAGLRWRSWRRAIFVLVPVLTGWFLIALPSRMFATAGFIGASWREAVIEANFMHFALLSGLVLAIVAVIAGLVAPLIAAMVFRAVLPPRDRRLVAWIWEWRGKPVPKD